jgi:hypothetical protein
VAVLTKSRRQMCELSEAQEDLVDRPVEDGGDTCRAVDDTWWHVRVCVDAKLPHEECGGRQMKTMSGLTRMPCG